MLINNINIIPGQLGKQIEREGAAALHTQISLHISTTKQRVVTG